MKTYLNSITASLLACSAAAQHHKFTLEEFPTNVVHVVALQGETMELEAQENRSTGYSWHLAEIVQDVPVMQLKSTQYFSGDNDDMVGVSGLRSVELECLEVGSAQFRMAYAREHGWTGFFPQFRNGLKEKDTHIKQYIINVNCKGESEPSAKTDKERKASTIDNT